MAPCNKHSPLVRPCSPLEHVCAGRISKRGMGGAAHWRWLDPLARPLDEPRCPVGPPAAIVARGGLPPMLCGGRRRVDLVRPIGALAAGRVDDARDMAG